MLIRTCLAMYEIKQVIVTPCGRQLNKDLYTDMHCFITMRYGDGEYEVIEGEFDCSGAMTFEECEESAQEFLDDLYHYRKIDISTDEKCAKYGLTLI